MSAQNLPPVTPEEAPVTGLDQLPRERQPSQDLWAGIEARLAQPRAQRRREPSLWPYALAASVCLALLTGVLLRSEPVAPSVQAAAQVAVAEAPVTEAEQGNNFDSRPYSNSDHNAAMASLSPRTLRMLRTESLDNAPALVAERADASGFLKATYSAGSRRNAHGQQAILRANLKLVVQAEREVRRALEREPQSPSLQSLLVLAQEKRAALTNLLIHEPD